MTLRACMTGVLLLVAAHCDASTLGVRPAPPPLPDPFATLSTPEREQLIALQEEVLHREERSPDAELYFRLGILHFAGDDFESRNRAVAAFEQARILAPERLEIRLWEARTRARMKNELAAIALLDEVADRFGHDPAWAYSWGYYHWLRARHFLLEDDFAAARTGFLRAAKAEPAVPQYRLALAAAGLMTQDWETVLAATSTLHEGDRVLVPSLLLRACGELGRGSDAQAHEFFQRAMVSLPRELSDAFLAAKGVLPAWVDDEAAARTRYWRTMDPHPARQGNLRRMEFFRRMIEAELVFGVDETPGWQTQTGQAWIRWGRPTGTVFVPADIDWFEARSRPGAGKTVGVLQAGFFEVSPAENGYTLSDVDPNQHRWYWYYGLGDAPIRLTFVDATFNYDWSFSSQGARSYREATKRLPLAFVESVPPPDIDLDLAVCGFVRGDEWTSLEAAVAVLPQEDFAADAKGSDGSLARLDWALYDERNRMIENGTLQLDDSRWRRNLLRETGLELQESEKNALIGQLGFRLRPGRYRLAAEAVREATGAQRNAVVEFELAKRPAGQLMLSDLELADSYHRFDNDMRVPREFVKHAYVIVPNAHRAYPVGSQRAYVYYEIDGLAAGQAGTTHFDVAYRVEAVDEGGASTPTSNEFLAEETGTSPDQKVIKGTRVDLAGLGPGRYRLVVEVRDRNAQATAERRVEFTVFDPRGAPREGS